MKIILKIVAAYVLTAICALPIGILLSNIEQLKGKPIGKYDFSPLNESGAIIAMFIGLVLYVFFLFILTKKNTLQNTDKIRTLRTYIIGLGAISSFIVVIALLTASYENEPSGWLGLLSSLTFANVTMLIIGRHLKDQLTQMGHLLLVVQIILGVTGAIVTYRIFT